MVNIIVQPLNNNILSFSTFLSNLLNPVLSFSLFCLSLLLFLFLFTFSYFFLSSQSISFHSLFISLLFIFFVWSSVSSSTLSYLTFSSSPFSLSPFLSSFSLFSSLYYFASQLEKKRKKIGANVFSQVRVVQVNHSWQTFALRIFIFFVIKHLNIEKGFQSKV